MKFLDVDSVAIRKKSIVAASMLVGSWTILALVWTAQAFGAFEGIAGIIWGYTGFIVLLIAFASPVFVFIYGITLAITNSTPAMLAYGIVSAGLVAIAAGLVVAFQLGLFVG